MTPHNCPLCNKPPAIETPQRTDQWCATHTCENGFYIELDGFFPTQERAVESWNDLIVGLGKPQKKAGIIEGLKRFAWWKDGTQFVGTCGTTLKKAIEEVENENRTNV